jgi:hypothetical protein
VQLNTQLLNGKKDKSASASERLGIRASRRDDHRIITLHQQSRACSHSLRASPWTRDEFPRSTDELAAQALERAEVLW